MTNFKILINSKGVPVLIEAPTKPLTRTIEAYEYYEKELADESKHIAFTNIKQVQDLIFHQSNGEVNKFEAGQIFDLPENIGVSFEEIDVRNGNQMMSTHFWHEWLYDKVKVAVLTPESEPSSKQREKKTIEIEIPEWILKYDRANYQSGAGKAVRELLNIIKKLQS